MIEIQVHFDNGKIILGQDREYFESEQDWLMEQASLGLIPCLVGSYGNYELWVVCDLRDRSGNLVALIEDELLD